MREKFNHLYLDSHERKLLRVIGQNVLMKTVSSP